MDEEWISNTGTRSDIVGVLAWSVWARLSKKKVFVEEPAMMRPESCSAFMSDLRGEVHGESAGRGVEQGVGFHQVCLNASTGSVLGRRYS